MKTIILLLFSLGVCHTQTPSSDLSMRQKVVAGSMDERGNLTKRVELWDKEGVTYNPLEFELLKLEISEMESLVTELRSSLTGSNGKMEALYMEIQKITALVNQLEGHDKNSIPKFQREIASLQKRLNEDTCKHGRILNISKPEIVQVNWKGKSYKTGGWGKDTFFGSTRKLHWVLPESSFSSIRFYNSYNDLKQYKNYKDRKLSMYGKGSGLNLHNNALYYNCHSELCRFGLDTNKVDQKTIPDAVFNNTFSYASSQNQYLDIEGDELGLWVLYAEGAGDMNIGLLNETSLDLMKTWPTSVYKPSATNAFMVCGVMYVTRALNTREEDIFYMYDTNTGEEQNLNIKFEKMSETVQSLSYNANDHKLYMYNDGFEVLYDIDFQPLA
ncbi:olfactomedin-4-like [Hyla sarda]|uniref:olfactomedin-4-like n=1 Tax=Hyla sarda TaxID=327740 RepID=UPI0024C3B032|nr:olfactomedin-4-like [Hyla sarda]